jgi:probable phosphoglycerate mutase
MTDRLPSYLWTVRHGESAGNVARDRAQTSGSQTIDLTERDMDVPLSDLGQQQADALGRWFAALPPSHQPDLLLTSPYMRAWQTAAAIGQHFGQAAVVVDERLREKEFGSLDRLTKTGIDALFPEQAKLRTAIGKFYYRPPGGESWCDVILRLRGMYDSICLQHAGKRVLIVSHQVVVLCLRYVLEGLDEKRLLAIDAAGDVANCAVTEYGPRTQDGAALALRRYNYVAPLENAGAPVTQEPDKGSSA